MYRPAVIELARAYNLDDAEDATQDFFTYLLEHEVLGDADRQRGRFRSFLRATFRDFLRRRRRNASTARRGGGHEHEPLHEHTDPDELPDPDADPDEAFNLMWARAQVAHATNDLAGDYARRGLKDRFRVLSTFIYRDPEPGEYAELAPRLGLSTNAVASAVVRMRERHRLLVLGFVADTTASSEEEAVEFGELEGSLGRLVRWG